jgi:hypothetical protein
MSEGDAHALDGFARLEEKKGEEMDDFRGRWLVKRLNDKREIFFLKKKARVKLWYNNSVL